MKRINENFCLYLRKKFKKLILTKIKRKNICKWKLMIKKSCNVCNIYKILRKKKNKCLILKKKLLCLINI